MTENRMDPTLPADAECSRTSAALRAAFPRDLEAKELLALETHAMLCPRCSEVLARAREQQDWLAAWTVPQPSAQAADRFVSAIVIDGAQRSVCARKRQELEAALRDERVDPQVSALRSHVAQCAQCSEIWANDHASDRMVAQWLVPAPPRGFVDGVLARLRHAGIVRNAPRWSRIAASIAALALLGVGAWLAFGIPSRPAGTPPIAVVDVDRALARFGGDVHVVQVMNAQSPAGIGSFAPTAIALDRAPTQPGAGFLRALRKVRRNAATGDGR
jgi:hypothetical protein